MTTRASPGSATSGSPPSTTPATRSAAGPRGACSTGSRGVGERGARISRRRVWRSGARRRARSQVDRVRLPQGLVHGPRRTVARTQYGHVAGPHPQRRPALDLDGRRPADHDEQLVRLRVGDDSGRDLPDAADLPSVLRLPDHLSGHLGRPRDDLLPREGLGFELGVGDVEYEAVVHGATLARSFPACASTVCGVSAQVGGHSVANWRHLAGRVIVEGMADTEAAASRPHQHDTREAVLFGGVYGSVLACSMVAALTQYGHTSRG